MTPVAAVFALLIGLALGMLGAGGSAIAVPVFVYALGLPAKEAVASSLPVVGAVTLVGALRHARCGNVDFRLAALFAPTAMAGAYAGGRLASLISGNVQLALFGIVMLAASALMFRDSLRGCDAPLKAVSPRPGRTIPLVLMGAAVGTMTGLVGVGGGFLIVPALALLAGLPMRSAVGTSLLVISANSGSGFLGYVSHVSVQWELIVGFATVSMMGVFLGSALCDRISQQNLRRSFAVLLAGVAVFILGQQAGSRGDKGGTDSPVNVDRRGLK